MEEATDKKEDMTMGKEAVDLEEDTTKILIVILMREKIERILGLMMLVLKEETLVEETEMNSKVNIRNMREKKTNL